MAALSLQEQLPIKQENSSTALHQDGFVLCIWESAELLDSATTDLK